MNNIQKDEILKKCFAYFVEHGLERISMRKMCDETGMAISSAYYWFKDKDEMILDATEYGVKEIVDRLFGYAMENIKDIQKMCEEFPSIVRKYENTLKAIFQIATSPRYGEKIIKLTNGFSSLYDIYAKKLSEQLHIPYEKTRQLVNLFISAIVDCVTWSDWDKLNSEMNFIFNLIKEEVI